MFGTRTYAVRDCVDSSSSIELEFIIVGAVNCVENVTFCVLDALLPVNQDVNNSPELVDNDVDHPQVFTALFHVTFFTSSSTTFPHVFHRFFHNHE